MKAQKQDASIIVTRVEESSLEVVLVGKSPLILNRMSEKAKHELLFPKGRKTAADKAANMKHNPLTEFRASAHIIADASSPTLLAIPAAAPKKSLATAALDMPGAKKAQIGRLSWVPGEYVGIFGVPKLFMSITRSADMNHTPDVRTRCIVPDWAAVLRVNFVTPILNPTIIINLLVASGMYIGLGDWRNEKGAGSFGQFEVMTLAEAKKVESVSKRLLQGRDVQMEAMEAAEPYDQETAELLTWFEAETKTRGKAAVA